MEYTAFEVLQDPLKEALKANMSPKLYGLSESLFFKFLFRFFIKISFEKKIYFF